MSAIHHAAADAPLLDPAARLELLTDPGSFRALRTAVGDGVVAGAGRVAGRSVFCWAQDGSYRGGSLGAAGGETIARTIRMAHGAGVPVIGFPWSGGARLQEGVAALTAYGAIFRAQAVADVPQISVVCGPCAGGAAYSPALGDITIMSGPEARMFLTGPRVIEKVTNERVDSETLGGPRAQATSGIAHLLAADDLHARELVRGLLAHLPARAGASLPLLPSRPPAPGDPSGPMPDEERRVYDVRAVAGRLFDGGDLIELGARWARNIVVGFACLEGAPVGLIANQPRHLGGCIDAAAAEKGAWFVRLCDRFGVPLVVLVDTPGFLPGVRQERAGVIRHGAALLQAFGAAAVPRVTVTLRAAYGGAHIVMNSRDLGATATFAWPGAKLGVMGARQAVEIVERRAIAAGEDADALAAAYAEEHLPVGVAAAGGFVDEVIDPGDTRARIGALLEAHR